MQTNQLGRFSVPLEIIQKTPEKVAHVFWLLEAVVIDAKSQFYPNAIEYGAISPKFREVPEGEMIPWYHVVVSSFENEIVEVTVEERDERECVSLLYA